MHLFLLLIASTKKVICCCLFVVVTTVSFAQTNYQIDSVIYHDNFTQPLAQRWITECVTGAANVIAVKNSNLELDTHAGVTVWYNQPLSGNYLVEFNRTVIMQNGANDRLSDFNFFWMASDPKNASLFTRKGAFPEYDSLLLYYVGIGGNYNTTTRFRKYDGKGERILLQEYTDANHLLVANTDYKIRILVKNGTSSIWVNDILYFTYHDAQPINSGYFGFRSTQSHQTIRNFVVYGVK